MDMKRLLIGTLAVSAILCGIAIGSSRFTNFPNSIGIAGTEVTSTATQLNLLNSYTADEFDTRIVSVPIACTNADTNIAGVLTVNRAMTITEASVSFSQAPSSLATVGTSSVKLEIRNWDASASAFDTLVSATPIDTAKAAGDNEYLKDLTLHSAGNLTLADGDKITARVISAATTTVASTTCQGGNVSIGFTQD